VGGGLVVLSLEVAWGIIMVVARLLLVIVVVEVAHGLQICKVVVARLLLVVVVVEGDLECFAPI
jgi:hypothetical protein